MGLPPTSIPVCPDYRLLRGMRYAALARMVDEGLVTESTPKDDASGGPAPRHYQRTRFGRAVARAESGRLPAFLDVARTQNMFGGQT